jgi:hypothetical protein
MTDKDGLSIIQYIALLYSGEAEQALDDILTEGIWEEERERCQIEEVKEFESVQEELEVIQEELLLATSVSSVRTSI